MNEAETARARLVQQGMEEVVAVREQVESAMFFELADLYRQCRAGAEDIRTRYEGSEVEVETERLIREIDEALGLLEEGDHGAHQHGDRDRLRGVLEAIDPSRSPELYERVKSAIEGTPGEEES